MKKFSYRPEIDGLRSIAVFSVIIYHAKISFNEINIFPGGFIGVDIFFVISGYLITSIILNDIENGKFSFFNFYERRIRRILPALFFIMLFSLPFAWEYLLPYQFIEYAYSLITSIIFSSNFYFWLIGEQYATESALLKPFLHTWSLAVEEQYYIIFPLILYLCIKYLKRYFFLIFIGTLIFSLILAELGSRTHPSLNFYILPTRGWELLIGSILAKLEIDQGRTNYKFLRNLMPAIGLLLIFFSFILFNDDVFHPSILTMVPTLGVAFLIYFCQKGEIITDFLSNRIFVGLGLISYSLYLWHYPIFAFARIDDFLQDSFLIKLFLIFVTFVLSVLTYFLIERPFRNRNFTSVKKLFSFLFVVGSIVLISSSLIVKKNGFVERAPEILKNQYVEDLQKIVTIDDKDCFDRIEDHCIFNPNAKKSIILVGDSHIEVLHKPLLDYADKSKVKLTLMTNSACAYYPKFNRINRKTKKIEECDYKLQQIRTNKIISDSGAIVILGGRYPVHLSEELFDNKEGGIEGQKLNFYFEPKDKKTTSVIERKELLSNGFIEGVNRILKNGNKVILIYPIPVVGWIVPVKFMNSLPNDDSKIEEYISKNPITTSYKVYLERTKDTYKMLDSIEDSNVYRIYPEKLFCNNLLPNRCVTHSLKDVYYRDDNHLSYKGTKMLMKLVENEINKILK